MTSTETITQLRSVPKSTPNDEIIDIVAQDGGVIIEQLVSPQDVDAFNAEIDPYVQSRAPGSVASAGADVAWGENTKRLTNLIMRSKTFRENIVTDRKFFDLAKIQLKNSCDDFWMNTAQLIDIGPGSLPGSLHRDMVNYPAFVPMGKNGPEVMCNFLVAFTDFTEDNGATRVIPRSHHWDDYTNMGSLEDTIPAVMKAGSAMFFTGKLVHAGGANITDGWRRAVTMPFNPGWLVPEEAYPLMIDLETARTLPKHVQQITGFRTFYNTAQNGGYLWTADYLELADWLKL